MSNLKQKVFLSGGFKSNWQEGVVNACKDSFTFYNPREHGLPKSDEYTAWDIHYVRSCDIVFAYMEASNPSGYGLTFEIGIAYALNKTIILVDERSEKDAFFEKYFKIVHSPSSAVFQDLQEGINFLMKFTQ